MTNIIIKNFGPIKNVEISLKKLNVFIGPQSSGKSTIAKVISFFRWVEKRYILEGEFKYDFTDQFINFHRISDIYFSKDTFLQYSNEFIEISYKGSVGKSLKINKGNDREYQLSKNIYIPSERNFVSVIPNIGKYSEKNDNILSFIYDWSDAKRKYDIKKSFSILNLEANYYYKKDSDKDFISLNNKKNLLLQNASSGLQSIVPLSILLDYLTGYFYSENKTSSFEENSNLVKLLMEHMDYIIGEKRTEEFERFKSNKEPFNFSKKELDKLVMLVNNRRNYFFTNFIIEEPEQNLFPKTQRDLIYYLIERLSSENRLHTAVLTTHSPYILYAINNCILGKIIENKVGLEERKEFESSKSWISPDDVGVWEIDKNNGTLRSIKESELGTISKHYFNSITNDIMDEYYKMLSFVE